MITSNRLIVDLFEYLPRVLAKSREKNRNKSYIDYFIKWQKWANQFPEVNATQQKRYMLFYRRRAFFKIIDHIHLSEHRITQLNILSGSQTK